MGSTFGTPDMWFVVPLSPGIGTTVWVELKIAVVVGGVIEFEVRPEQRKVLRELVDEMAPAFLLVGEQMSRRKWLMKPNSQALGGRVDVSDHGLWVVDDGPKALIQGVIGLWGS